MDFIQNSIFSSSLPIVTAILLGLIVSVHPCTLAANIAAMGYISKDVENPKRVFHGGLFFALGRILAFCFLGIIITLILQSGAEFIHLTEIFGEWGEKILGILLIIVGILLLIIEFYHKKNHCHSFKINKKKSYSFFNCTLLGVILALSFCPESAFIYFGVLLPLSAKTSYGCILPILFSIASAIPAVFIAWAIAFGISSLKFSENKLNVIKKWINLIVGLLFILSGVITLLI